MEFRLKNGRYVLAQWKDDILQAARGSAQTQQPLPRRPKRSPQTPSVGQSSTYRGPRLEGLLHETKKLVGEARFDMNADGVASLEDGEIQPGLVEETD